MEGRDGVGTGSEGLDPIRLMARKGEDQSISREGFKLLVNAAKHLQAEGRWTYGAKAS